MVAASRVSGTGRDRSKPPSEEEYAMIIRLHESNQSIFDANVGGKITKKEIYGAMATTVNGAVS